MAREGVAPEAPAVPAPAPGPEDPYLTGTRRRAAPAVRRLAREHGIALADISDRDGRVSMSAIRAAIATASPQAMGGAAAEAPTTATPAGARALNTTPVALQRTSSPAPSGGRRPLEGARRRIAERMSTAHEAPHITLVREVQVAELVRLRKALAPTAPSITALIAAATIRALRAHPDLNSTFEEGAIIGHEDVNLGIAVARPEGLIVPVIHGAQNLSVMALADEMRRLGEAARTGGLTIADVSDGSFTITSLGQAGIDLFSPLVNPPQVAILGVGRVLDRVVPIPSGIGVVPTVFLSLTCDHRVIDGYPGAEFLATLAEALETPTWLWASGAGG